MNTVGDPAVTGAAAPASDSLPATLADLLNPAAMARMANEFFAALPGNPAPPATLPPAPPATVVAAAPPATPPVEVGALPAAAAVPPASAFAPPTEAALRPVPANVAGALGLPTQAAVAAASSPSGPYDFRPELVPEPAFRAPPATAPGAAGALTTPPATPAAPTAAAVAPSAADRRALPATLTDTPRLQPAAASAPAAGTSYYFLETVRPAPPDTAPAVPFDLYGFDPAMLPDLKLIAGPYDPRTDRQNFPNLQEFQ